MKKKYIAGLIVIIGIIIVGGIYMNTTKKTKNNLNVSSSATIGTVSNENSNYKKPQFTNGDSENYYKLSQLVGDIGMPSASMTSNLDAYTTIKGVNYYKTYSYDTRASVENDNSTVVDSNYSHLINTKTIALDGQVLTDTQKFDFSKLTNQQKYDDVYRLAAMYVEGYTANNPKLVVNDNDDYQGNLNSMPQLEVNLNDTKNIDGETLYKVTVNVNNQITPIYVGLDGYIFVASQEDYNQLFFPSKTN